MAPGLMRSDLLFLCFLTFFYQYANAARSTSELFPSYYEEYDSWILDPEHGYGSPYGGFSRATRSRLAALPLFLPNTDNAPLDNNDAMHMEVRDAAGRLFICRVYHEDELEADSLNEGLFEYPKLKRQETIAPASGDGVVVNEAAGLVGNDNTGPAANAASLIASSDGRHNLKLDTAGSSNEITATSYKTALDKSSIFRRDDDDDEEEDAEETQTLAQFLSKKSEKEVIAEIDQLLEPLSGLCAQTHKGWWSYEWCYKDRVTQFHVEISKTTSSVQVEDVTSLGTYERRSVSLVTEQHEEEASNDGTTNKNPLAQGRPEVARVEDLYLHGTACPGQTKKRQSLVRLVCCSKSTIQSTMGLVHRDNVHVTTDVMSIFEVSESKTNICTYNVTICTPLLCEDETRYDGSDLSSQSARGSLLKSKNSMNSPPKENESVMEILERTLSGFCLQSSTGGWWTYEICHKKNIRQYHESVGARKNKNGAVYTARTVETDHNLGNYQPNVFAAIVPEDEWKFVVNATDRKGGAKKPYFELEYIGGDVCDHSDVTDAAIVAGGSSQKGISRASSVRYQCGETYDISVSEDSTCHYIVSVDLPDLCKHPLFQQPVSKKQVFKCLHVPEEPTL
ncbi:hypothetical protein ACA910_005306 [Epithemia clementina (nom. ined.)]